MPNDQGIRIKSYFTASVEAAVVMARRELGADAMLLNSRKTDGGSGQTPLYEVVFGVPQPSGAEVAQPSSKLVVMAGKENGEDIGAAPPCTLPGMRQGLVDAGLPESLAEEILESVQQRLDRETAVSEPEREPRTQASDLLRYELRSRITVSAELGREQAARRIVALVGPPGAGKSMSLVKLALTEGLAKNLDVQIVTLDTHRIFGADQLRSCASILGAGFHVVREFASLAQVLARCPQRDLILIDTPGLSAADAEEVNELAGALAAIPDLDVHMVLPATLNFDDAADAVRRFLPLGPAKLLVTRLDEASRRGPMFAVAARLQMPISYFCGGLRMAEDIHPATRDALVGMLMRPVQTRLASAA